MASGKGRSTSPNAVRNAADNRSKHRKDFPYIPTLLHGPPARLKITEVEKQLPELTRAAQEQNLLLDDAAQFAFVSGRNPIHHVIYIVKENRTYDQILGDLKVGDGDPSLVLYGEDINPKQHQLAFQFVMLVNFYDSAQLSGAHPQWTPSSPPT